VSLQGTLARKKYTCFFGSFSREYEIKNIFNTHHHKIIYAERDIWMKKMLSLAIPFINDYLMTSLFLL